MGFLSVANIHDFFRYQEKRQEKMRRFGKKDIYLQNESIL
jgi:hypothetical protein